MFARARYRLAMAVWSRLRALHRQENRRDVELGIRLHLDREDHWRLVARKPDLEIIPARRNPGYVVKAVGTGICRERAYLSGRISERDREAGSGVQLPDGIAPVQTAANRRLRVGAGSDKGQPGDKQKLRQTPTETASFPSLTHWGWSACQLRWQGYRYSAPGTRVDFYAGPGDCCLGAEYVEPG